MHTAIVRGPQQRGQNQKRLRHPCILGGSRRQTHAGQKSELATSAMPSRGPKTRRSCYATPAFSRVPDAKRGDKITSGSLALAFSGVPNKGHEITRGYLTPAFSGAQKRVESLRKPRILGGPQRQTRGQNQKWLPHPCLLGAPKAVRMLRIPCVVGGPQQRGQDQKRLRHTCLLGGPRRQTRGKNQN